MNSKSPIVFCQQLYIMIRSKSITNVKELCVLCHAPNRYPCLAHHRFLGTFMGSHSVNVRQWRIYRSLMLFHWQWSFSIRWTILMATEHLKTFTSPTSMEFKRFGWKLAFKLDWFSYRS